MSEMKVKVKLNPKLISDQPTSVDKFEAHLRIALAVKELIKENKGGKTISIEGAWGSGKSIVVKLLNEELQKEPNKKLICYDAWSHSGDSLRRSFLNTVIDELVSNKWLKDPNDEFVKKHPILSNRGKLPKSYSDKNFWSIVKDALSGRFKTSSKEVTPELKPDGALLIILMMIFPLASLFVVNMYRGYVLDDYFFVVWPSWVHGFFVVCIFFVIAPFLHLISVKSKAKNDNLLLFLINKTTTEETSSTIEALEPTTIEFQEIFSSVMDMALTEDDKRLIIVIDNLDRLKNQQEAESVWSLLRSFIDPNSFKSEIHPWVEKIWVVIPLASNNENQITNNVIHEDPTGNKIDNPATKGTAEQNLQKKPEQFLDKVFQVRYRIPPPVLTNWENYLYELIDNAFGNNNVDLEEKRNIHWLYDHYQSEITRSRPTPRSLILFVNEIVALRTLWDEVFSITTIAAFCLDSKGKDVLLDLQTNQIPNTIAISILGSDIKKDYASLFFNVSDKNKALELLYVPLIEALLKAGNTKELLDLLRGNNYTIEFLLKGLKKWLSEWSRINPFAFFHALIVVQTLLKKDDETPIEFIDESKSSLIYRNAKSSFNSFNGLPFLVENIVEGCKAFVDIANDVIAPKIILDSIKRFKNSQPEVRDGYPNQITELDKWLEKLEVVINLSGMSVSLNECEDFSIELPISYANWLEVCEKYIDKDFEEWRKFRPTESHTEISKSLADGLESQVLGKYDSITLNWMAKINALSDYLPVFKSIENIVTVRVMNDSELSLFLDLFLKNYKSQTFFQESSKRILDLGGYYYQFYYAQKSGFVVSRAKILCLLLLTDKSIPNADVNPQAQAGYTQIKEILNSTKTLNENDLSALSLVVQTYALERLIIDLSIQNFDSHSNIQSLILAHPNKNKIYDTFDIINLSYELSNYTNRVFSNSIDKTRKEIVSYLINNAQLLERILVRGLNNKDNYLYFSILLVNPKNLDRFIEALKKLIAGIRENQWEADLKTTSSLSRIMIIMKQRSIACEIGTELYNSLLKIFNGSLKEKLYDEGVKAAMSFLNSGEMKKLESKMLLSIKSTTKAYDENHWKCFGDSIVKVLSTFNGKKSIATILNKLIIVEDYYGLNFIVSRLKNDKKLIDPFITPYSELRSLVTEKIKNGVTPDQKRLLNRLKKLIQRSKL